MKKTSRPVIKKLNKNAEKIFRRLIKNLSKENQRRQAGVVSVEWLRHHPGFGDVVSVTTRRCLTFIVADDDSVLPTGVYPISYRHDSDYRECVTLEDGLSISIAKSEQARLKKDCDKWFYVLSTFGV
jgi:hypothetical protein